MKMIKRKNFISLLGIMIVMSMTSVSHAQWPTLDLKAIAETIQSKTQLAKQTAIGTDSVQIGGQMNTILGTGKGSISKFAGDNIQKAKEKAEKFQKQKERFEENKKKLDKAKEEADKAKEQYEKAQKSMAEAKKTANDAKKTVDETKSSVKEAKQIANNAKAEVQEDMPSVKNKTNVSGSNINKSSNNNRTNNAKDSFVNDYVADYEAGINSNAKVYETVQPQSVSRTNVLTPQTASGVVKSQSMSTTETLPVAQATVNSTSQEKMDMEASAVSSDTNSETTSKNVATDGSFRKPFEVEEQTKEEKANRQLITNSKVVPADTSLNKSLTPPTSANKDDVAGSTNSISLTPKTEASSVTKGTTTPAKGFRQRATIKKNVPLDKGASLDVKQVTKLASYKSSQTLMFGAEEYIPDGVVHNGVYEETIIPEALVDYCNIGVDKLNDPTLMEECLKKLIRHMSDADSQVAAEGKSKVNQIGAENIVSTVSESMQMKNIAANYEEEVLNKFEEQASSASTTRDDSAVLAQTNKEIQILLNKLITMQAAQLSQTALGQLGSLTAESLGKAKDKGDDSWYNG